MELPGNPELPIIAQRSSGVEPNFLNSLQPALEIEPGRSPGWERVATPGYLPEETDGAAFAL